MLKTIIKKIIKILKIPFVLGDYFRFKKLEKDERFKNSISNFYPQIRDKTIKTGFDRHYIYHTAWAARKISETKPEFHTDISSSLYFSVIASAFVPVKFYDYRPADLELSNFSSNEADLLKLPFKTESIKSLSCMHVVEHVGLGRYGEKLDYEGDLKAISELKRVLSQGGSLFFVVPVGVKAKIEFNAHRVYTPEMIKNYFSDLELKEFFLIPEKNGGGIVNPEKEVWLKEDYACGCFWFTKK